MFYIISHIFYIITNSWEQRKAKELCSITTGKSNTQDQVEDGQYPFFIRSDVAVKSNKYLYDEEAVITIGDGNIGKVFHYVNGKFDLHQRCYKMADFENLSAKYFYWYFSTKFYKRAMSMTAKATVDSVRLEMISDMDIKYPVEAGEQNKISSLLFGIDNLITLHQRKCLLYREVKMNKKQTFYQYFLNWIEIYKKGAIRGVTLKKYYLSLSWVKKLVPKLRLCDIDRISYQELLNNYALTHERQTTMDFHHHLKAAILDAVDDNLISRDPTRKVIIKGIQPGNKKQKYLNQFQLHTLLKTLHLGSKINGDWLILLIAKTGMRFSEAIALTPDDFDFPKQTIFVNKTWNYKDGGGFSLTKNKTSVRKIQIDWMVSSQFAGLIEGLEKDQPIFIKKRIFNSTINDVLKRRCVEANVPIITIHGLRHTHASLLLFEGVSIASVAKRLGHASINTTEKTYLHIIRELENKDIDLVMRSLSGLI